MMAWLRDNWYWLIGAGLFAYGLGTGALSELRQRRRRVKNLP